MTVACSLGCLNALDVLRVLIMALGGVTLGLAGFVLQLYWRANRIARQREVRVPGALPYHVALVATSHVLLILGAIGIVERRLGDDVIWWGAPITLVAFTLSLIGLIDMLGYQKLRIVALMQERKPTTRRKT